ncbi:organic solvent ABC transporter substrate-binding protein [Paramagnetospirillum kuznetsovii]|uniref:Organic solvent ABC transporter substrate-binding protein n=1 Tax=Paramagnetospirillum kuznetsovii TaxID=2053833 RepID=A0A364NWC0_9PROT|nr:outer membrane lipid asymmetry maintenance protein MlaD [Paramagnetospirillum kuznetsovii]RAU21389.1 organic solvent ABC transporter substrate-binding protein [Paramagnetospirillum kuznetsovii]
MPSRNDRDTVTGGAVVLVGALLLTLAFSIGGKATESTDGYTLKARFNRADGISIGSQVRLSGTVVGRVVEQSLDDRYRAVLTLRLRPDLQLASDTAAVIYTDGLLGAKFVELKLGGEDKLLKSGQEIQYTQDAVVIEDLLDMIIQQARSKRGYLDKPLPSSTN